MPPRMQSFCNLQRGMRGSCLPELLSVRPTPISNLESRIPNPESRISNLDTRCRSFESRIARGFGAAIAQLRAERSGAASIRSKR